jgi:penicillin-binding protein 1A
MGRDDAAAVPGLQGGTAPARAFAAYMRYAVRNRPVEPFETDLKLPDWQLEPDEEYMFGGDPDDYYYIDEQGNLVEPQRPGPGQDDPFPAGGEQVPGQPVRRPVPGDEATQAASDDFLDNATGARPPVPGPPPAARPRATGLPPPQPGATPRPGN